MNLIPITAPQQIADPPDRLHRLAGITEDTPLRLSTAAKIAFPDGSVTKSTLQTEARKGRLVLEKIGGRYFTTLRAIEEMRQLCRVAPNPLASGFAAALVAPPSTSSSTRDLRSARAAALIASERRRKH